jgi:hypothetical protein
MGAVLIGIPAGILAGLLFFFRVALTYPFQMYRIANDRWLEKIESKQEDMWARHIRRMEEKEKFYKNSN